MNKIIRSLCYFTREPSNPTVERINFLSDRLLSHGFEIQTRRICSAGIPLKTLDHFYTAFDIVVGGGTMTREEILEQADDFLECGDLSINLEIIDHVSSEDVDLLFEIIRRKPEKTFNFSYTFNNVRSSPFFPSANYEKDGFSIGLQPTDLAEGCTSLHTWLYRLREVWAEIVQLFGPEGDFLGIDSSIAPLFGGNSSLIHHIKRIHGNFSRSVTSDAYLGITRFIKEENPKPIGLCGLMFPCLEDFDLADEYQAGEFSIERNIFLSLHSGLGIDTYPIGTDESPERVRQILNLLLGLAEKYQKPLSARFVSDGKARIGDHTNFRNQYLKDVVVRPL